MIEEVFYEDPQVLMNKPPPPKFEDSFEEVYDNIDEANAIRDLNKFPPPVWKQDQGLQPPPLPPSHPARRYTRSFNQSSEFVQVDEWRAAAASTKMTGKIRSNKPTVESPPTHKKHFGSLKNSPRTAKHKVKTKPPAPPAKPWKSGSSDDLLNTNSSELLRGGGGGGGGGRGGQGMTTGTRGMGFNLKNDPKFGKKLQERRQEIYGDTPEKNRPRSWGHDQEAYEEVPFTASDDCLSDDPPTQGKFAGPLNSSDDEYVDCQPHEDDDSPAAYLEHFSPERRVGGKGANTLKREEFLRRPPLPLPSHSSAGNPITQSPPKVPANSGGSRPPLFARPPVASSAGTDAAPPIPKRGNERPPMPLPGAVVDDISDDDDAPPVPRRHPHASDKHRAPATVGDSKFSSSKGLSPPDNTVPLPPRSQPPSSPPVYPPSPTSANNAPPLPQRGPRQFGSPSPTSAAAAAASQSKKPKPPWPIMKQRSLSPEDLASPTSAKSDHVFEPFTFGKGPPSVPNTLPQTTKKSNRAKPNPLVPAKNLQASTIGGTRPSYETKLPADIGMKPLKKKFIDSYETNLPASIGNRPPLQIQMKRPTETATSSSSSTNATTKPRPPIKPPVAVKPTTQPKSPPHLPLKPQVSKKPATGQYPLTHPKPPALTPKPAAATINLAPRANFTNSASSFNNSDVGYNAQPLNASSKPVRTRNAAASKPPAPPGKPKPLLPPTVDRRKPLPTPSC
jgi:hypothetical protein